MMLLIDLFQLQVHVYDERYPHNQTIATVNVIVNRNENGPEYDQNSYSFEIDETVGTLRSVGQVHAFDKDLEVRYSYSIYI